MYKIPVSVLNTTSSLWQVFFLFPSPYLLQQSVHWSKETNNRHISDHGKKNEWGWKGTSGGHLVQPLPAQVGPPSQLPRKMSISKDGDSTSSGGNLYHKMCHLVCFSLCSLPLVLLMAITEKNLAPSSSFFPSIRYSCILIRFPLNLLQKLYHFYPHTTVRKRSVAKNLSN